MASLELNFDLAEDLYRAVDMTIARASMRHSQPSDQKVLYANMMEEVNARLETIFVAAQGGYRMHEMLAEEFCYFQLRMLCESIACACLIAHGDLTGNVHKFRNQWSADRILKELAKLHPDFYPKPRIVTVTPKRIEVEHKTEGFLARAEFLKLYGLTHSRSHRGSLKDMAERPPYVHVNFASIVEWARKIEQLLNDHLIQSPDETHSWLVLQKAVQSGGHPLVVEEEIKPRGAMRLEPDRRIRLSGAQTTRPG
jgi:hypothetical protein